MLKINMWGLGGWGGISRIPTTTGSPWLPFTTCLQCITGVEAGGALITLMDLGTFQSSLEAVAAAGAVRGLGQARPDRLSPPRSLSLAMSSG